jgi:hypothetical protein
MSTVLGIEPSFARLQSPGSSSRRRARTHPGDPTTPDLVEGLPEAERIEAGLGPTPSPQHSSGLDLDPERPPTSLDLSAMRRHAQGMTAPVDRLMQEAVKARQRAQTAIGEAVREARAAGWSWDRMSTALGGSPTAEALRMAFAATSTAEQGAGECPGCGGERGCTCGGGQYG